MERETPFIIIALVLFILAGILLIGTSPYSHSGGSKFEWRRRRRTLAIVFFIVGILALAVASLMRAILILP